ncbi:MAG: hypothetical protein QOF89_5325 [Acidobacteriota bacterium]|jgi:hypothetical protein|nr:hypothetical protein [Acidobacteriota bacterium]
MRKWFATGLALVSLTAAVPLQAGPVWVPVVGPQGADGRVIATRLRISNAGRAEKTYSATEAGLIQVEASPDREVDAWIETARGGRTFITRVPVISEQNRSEAGAVSYLNGLDPDASRLGLVNLAERSAVCLVDLLRADGSATGARATIDVPALAQKQLDGDALGLSSDAEAASAQITCDAPFYAYAVTVDPRTSEVAIATPEAGIQAKAKAKTPVASKASVVFTASGLLHEPTPQKEKGIVRVPVPRALNLSRMVIDWDVTPGAWSTKNSAGVHALLWMHRGRFRSNTVANVNFLGPGANRFRNNQNLDLPALSNTNGGTSMTLEKGSTYHFRYVYNAIAQTVEVTASLNGRVLRTLRMGGTASKHTITIPATGLVTEFGHYSFQLGPEVATLGWRYSNLRVEMIQK